MQELYDAVPIALAPVLGNPLSLAAAGVDRTLPLSEQVLPRTPSLVSLLRQHSVPSGLQRDPLDDTVDGPTRQGPNQTDLRSQVANSLDWSLSR